MIYSAKFIKSDCEEDEKCEANFAGRKYHPQKQVLRICFRFISFFIDKNSTNNCLEVQQRN